jgi:expansin (peptidoglycan-binding protein)
MRRAGILAVVWSLLVACGGSSGSSGSSSSGGASTSSSGGSTSSSGGSSTSGDPIGDLQHGEATYYDATGAGACSFDASPNDLMVAAMNQSQWSTSAVCGECVAVTGPSGQVTVRIVDLCPGCNPAQLDLSKEAFGKISPLAAGRVKIDWQTVPCDVTGPIAYEFKDGSSQYWTAIQVRNSKLPIQSFEWQSNGTWTPVNRTDYNYFVADKGMGTGALHVRVTAVGGAELVDTLPTITANATLQGAAQFP